MKKDIERKSKTHTKAESSGAADEKSAKKGIFSSRVAIISIAVIGVAFIIYALITLSGIHSQIRDLTDKLRTIEDDIVVWEIKVEEMKEIKNKSGADLSEYKERKVREELDYIKEGERVFVNVAGE